LFSKQVADGGGADLSIYNGALRTLFILTSYISAFFDAVYSLNYGGDNIS